MTNKAQKMIVRIGMSYEIPTLAIGEAGWDVDYHRLRMGDGTTTPPMIMSTKSVGSFEYNYIDYAQFPEIRMLPEGTVDGVDISDLNAANGFVVRRGNNLWAHRQLTNTDTYITIANPAGTAGDPVLNLSTEIVERIYDSLTEVAVDDETIHGNGRPEAPLYAHTATDTEKGVARFSTEEEILAGASANTMVSPVILLKRTATESRIGLIRKATQAEVNAGLSKEGAVVPAYLKTYTDNYIDNWATTQLGNYVKKGRIYTLDQVDSMPKTSGANYVATAEQLKWPRVVFLSAGASARQGEGTAGSGWRLNGQNVMYHSNLGEEGYASAYFTNYNNVIYRLGFTSSFLYFGPSLGDAYSFDHMEPMMSTTDTLTFLHVGSAMLVDSWPIYQRNYLE